MPSNVKTLLLLMGLSLTVSLANASPTVGRVESTCIDHYSFPANADSSLRSDSHAQQLTAYGSTDFSPLCADFVKPPIVSDSAEVLNALKVKPLPAVPGAIFMTLAGFFYVSLVRDRRFALAMKNNFAFVKGANG